MVVFAIELEKLDKNMEDVAALIEYCFEEPRPESLTGLLVMFSTCKIGKPWKNDKFRDAVSKHNELAFLWWGPWPSRLRDTIRC
jgi:hypothetical protein